VKEFLRKLSTVFARARPVLGWKSLKNNGLMGRQIIRLPGVPTCLGLALVSQSITTSICLSLSLSLMLHAAVRVMDAETSSNHLDDCMSIFHRCTYNKNQASVTKIDCYSCATRWWDKSYMWDQATVAWQGCKVTKITSSI
jgi:hypothetical protein